MRSNDEQDIILEGVLDGEGSSIDTNEYKLNDKEVVSIKRMSILINIVLQDKINKLENLKKKRENSVAHLLRGSIDELELANNVLNVYLEENSNSIWSKGSDIPDDKFKNAINTIKYTMRSTSTDGPNGRYVHRRTKDLELLETIASSRRAISTSMDCENVSIADKFCKKYLRNVASLTNVQVLQARDSAICNNCDYCSDIIEGMLNDRFDKIEIKYDKLLRKALEYLGTIKDPEHGIDHTLDVVGFTKQLIIKCYKNADIDIEACIIAAYWHDVGRSMKSEGHEEVSANWIADVWLDFGYSQDTIEKLRNAIINHKYDMKPTTIEGVIVRDADKLGFLGEGRWNSCLYNNCKLDAIMNLLPRLRHEILSLDESREIYDKLIVEILNKVYYYTK